VHTRSRARGNGTTTRGGSAALGVGVIEAELSSEGVGSSSLVAATEVGVRWLPVPARGDRCRGALVSAAQLSYHDIEELPVERGVEVDHVTVYRWVRRFTPLLADAARFCRHAPGTGGSSMRPTSGSTGGGGTCIGRSTSTGIKLTDLPALTVLSLCSTNRTRPRRW
jgi:hypothetical protein